MNNTGSKYSAILKISLFATGIAGIVAEYTLSTLASYFLGNTVFQWTMIVSLMLFAMGLGSKISQFFRRDLLFAFIMVEFILSLLSAFSCLLVYSSASLHEFSALLIYSLSISIGLLIGLEIPLVARLNDKMEELRVNIASVLEKDYYGSLLGGIFFAFIGLPILGLTYTPFVLGGINFLVAIFLFWQLRALLESWQRRVLSAASLLLAFVLLTGAWNAEQIILFGEQSRFKDKIVYSQQSRYQKIVITEWKGDYWLYINGNLQFSTYDEFLYHEVLVHPVMMAHPAPRSVLILGGGDGCALREVLKYDTLQEVVLVDLDPAMTNLGSNHPIFSQLNQHAFDDHRVQVRNEDAFLFVQERQFFDIIIADLPDPNSVELAKLYSQEFYFLLHKILRPEGILITQASSPYFAPSAFRCIEETIASAGFDTTPLRNQVPSMGEWGFIMASKTGNAKQRILSSVPSVPTRWLDADALPGLFAFGAWPTPLRDIKINRMVTPKLLEYYKQGDWDKY